MPNTPNISKEEILNSAHDNPNNLIRTSDVLPFQVRVSRGDFTDVVCVSKFGAAPSGVQTTATDIWSRADATTTQQIWLAPTAARIHTIASTSAADNTSGTGVDTVVIFYLPDWDTTETSETVTGNLNGGIAMSNAAVIIHRMKVVPQSTTTNVGGNTGTITATAAGDATITAVILPSEGQTEMAIYGVPSTQSFYLTRWNANVDKSSGASASVDFELRVNPNASTQTVAFIRKEDISLQSTGTSMFEKRYECYPKFPGPCIIKVQGIASTNDIDGESGFDGFIVTN